MISCAGGDKRGNDHKSGNREARVKPRKRAKKLKTKRIS